MTTHEQFADDLALYALGALQGDERVSLEKHLEECAICRRELLELRGDMGLLALSASGPKPPQRSRQRLMAAIAQEPRKITAPAEKRKAWWAGLEWVGALAAVLVFALLLRQNTTLRQRVAELETRTFHQQEAVEQARQVLATLTARDAARFTLVAANTQPQPQGKAIYVKSRGSLVFLANNLPALPPQKTYELWLIPASGAAPVPAGIFKPDARGSATVVNPPLPAGTEAKTFAITVEPESGSPAPTTQPIMVGVGE